jgi:hypothetical protein
MEKTLVRKRYELFTGALSEKNLRFYEKAGYTRFKEETTDDGIPFVYFEKKAVADVYMGLGMAIGAGLGGVVGVLTDNIGLWIGVGVSVGLAVGATLPMVKKRAQK